MANYTKQTQQDPGSTMPRWQKLFNLPSSTVLWDLSTGKRYRVGQLEPLYADKHQYAVNDFGVKGDDGVLTGERVSVNSLRLEGDSYKCSLMNR